MTIDDHHPRAHDEGPGAEARFELEKSYCIQLLIHGIFV
jgi:hypothetical protein